MVDAIQIPIESNRDLILPITSGGGLKPDSHYPLEAAAQTAVRTGSVYRALKRVQLTDSCRLQELW